MARLIIKSPDGKRGILEITKPIITIGRGAANDLVLNDPSVSRFHAVIKSLHETVHEPSRDSSSGKPSSGLPSLCDSLSGDALHISDRGSTNGVLLNGVRITEDVPLKNGDALRIGVYNLVFEDVDKSGAESLIIKAAEIPSALNSVLRGEVKRPAERKATENTSNTDLIETIRRLERENYLLTVLYDAGKALNSKLSVDDIAAQTMKLAFRIEGVERGFMMLFDPKGDVWRQTEVSYRDAPAEAAFQPEIILSRAILERVKAGQQPVLISDLAGDDRFSGSESLKISGLRSAMCAPLVGASRLFGILYVDNLQCASAFTQNELNVFALVAAQAAAAIDNATVHQQLAESAVQRTALERFLSPEVVELIAADPHGVRLGGANQKVSVMFADVRGFTSMSENMAPERVVEILNEYFTRVTDVIFDNGGTLDKYIGDAVMAVFGAPLSKGNDAAGAVRAAIEIQRLLAERNRDAAEREWPELRVGIGVNTGIVTAGNIGSPKRLDYTVIGDAVNTASRLMSNALGGQILISLDTAAEIGGDVDMKPLAPLMVKGKSAPIQVFEVDWRGRKRVTSAG